MSLKDFISLTDKSLQKDFSTPAFDVKTAREKILKVIDTANAQFGSTEPRKGPKRWKVNRNVVEFTLPVEIEGTSTFYIPSERFPEALKKIRAAIAAGEADAMLESTPEDQPKRKATAASTGDKPPRAGWSDERRARQAATIAARAASKEK